MRRFVLCLVLMSLSSPAFAEQDPVGNWKMVLKVGHVGEGLRTVILEVTEADGAYRARLTSMQNRMTDADEVLFEDDLLTVYYGSYEYRLNIDGDQATGEVTSPAGTQQVTAQRQDTQLLAGDTPELWGKTWNGKIERQDGNFVIVTRRNTFPFENASEFQPELASFVGKNAAVSGQWIVDKIRIQTIEPWEGRR